MIIQEQIENTDLIKTYSNNNMMIEQVETGARYAEAIDPVFMNREYRETNEPISDEEIEEIISKERDEKI